jgi:valyl-tRNA synthetase
MTAYKLFWDEFSSWYLETVKPAYQQPVDAVTYGATLDFFEKLALLLHPFMPFITEEVWQSISERKPGESIMTVRMPEAGNKDARLVADFEAVKQIVAGVRSVRLERNVPNREALTLHVVSGEHPPGYNAVIMKMCNLENIARADRDAAAATFMVGTAEYAVPLGGIINIGEETGKMEQEIRYLEGFLQSVMKKLGNEKFIANAKPETVANERKKQADTESKIKTLHESIAKLRNKTCNGSI